MTTNTVYRSTAATRSTGSLFHALPELTTGLSIVYSIDRASYKVGYEMLIGKMAESWWRMKPIGADTTFELIHLALQGKCHLSVYFVIRS